MKRFLSALLCLCLLLSGSAVCLAAGGEETPPVEAEELPPSENLPEDAGELPDLSGFSLEGLLRLKEQLITALREKYTALAAENPLVLRILCEDAALYTDDLLPLSARIEPREQAEPDKDGTEAAETPASAEGECPDGESGDTPVYALRWDSSDPTVATVDRDGLVTPLRRGSVYISCLSEDGNGILYDCVELRVLIPVKELVPLTGGLSLVLRASEPALAKGLLECDVLPGDADCRELLWSSDNEDVAAVDEEGRVTAVGPGVCTITAVSAEDRGRESPKQSFSVTVKQSVNSLRLAGGSGTLKPRERLKLTAEVLPENADDPSLLWESSDETVVTVNSRGEVTAVGRGRATIRCTARDGGGAAATYPITVVQPVTGLKIELNAVNLRENGKKTVPVTVSPSNADNPMLEWSSSDESVCTVNSRGIVSASGYGTATVSCRATDGSGKSASVRVTVSPTHDDREVTDAIKKRLAEQYPEGSCSLRLSGGEAELRVFLPGLSTVCAEAGEDWSELVTAAGAFSASLSDMVKRTLLREDLTVTLRYYDHAGKSAPLLCVSDGTLLPAPADPTK